jgi:hypothetical protein
MSPRPTTKNNEMHPKVFATSHLVFAVVVPILGLVLAFVSVTEMFPIYVNVAVYVLGLVGIEVGVWKWERAVSWAVVYRLLALASVALLYGGLLALPVMKQYSRENDMRLVFKDDAVFTWWRRWVIQQQYIKMRQYFVDLGVPVPKELPPIDVGENGADTVGFRDPAYRGNIGINREAIIRADKEGITRPYANYVIDKIVLPQPPVSVDEKAMRQFIMSGTFAEYFQASYWGRNNNLADWARQLWQIRDRMGQRFSDKLVAYTLLSVIDSEGEGQDRRSDAYFCNHLRIGYSVLSDDDKKWQDILHTMTFGYAKACPAH